MDRLHGKTKTTDTLEVDKIDVDLTIQHPLKESKVARMAQAYDPALAGTVTVSRRRGERAPGAKHKDSKGKYIDIIIDGYHRTESAKRYGFPYVEAQVWEDLSYEDENWLFAYLNDKSNPTKVYQFRARMQSGDEAAMDIFEILTVRGWNLATSKSSQGQFAAVAAAERIYGAGRGFKSSSQNLNGPALFAATMDVVTAAWGLQQNASDGAVLEGVAMFLTRYWETLDMKRLVKALSRTTPLAFRAAAEQAKAALKVRPALAYGWMVHMEYNKTAMMKNRLPNFAL